MVALLVPLIVTALHPPPPTTYGCDVSETVTIGTQVWAKNNCYTDTYPDGSDITAWDNTANDTFSYAETGTDTNTESAKGDAANEEWGNLYQWDAAMNGSEDASAQGICPDGYHIPTSDEFCALFNHLDTGGDFSCTGTDWKGTDAGTQVKDGGGSGFDAELAGGRRRSDSAFYNRTDGIAFWASSLDGNPVHWYIHKSFATVGRFTTAPRNQGLSVRCLQN
jgi:uncharacterized protein (TIGR02145 family)